MALAALCGDDESGRTWADVLQSRFGGHGPLADGGGRSAPSGVNRGDSSPTGIEQQDRNAIRGAHSDF